MQRTVIDCATGTTDVVPLTPEEIAEAEALAAEAAVEEAAREVLRTNAATIEDRMRQALDANATFLALASPTQAQTLAQVRRLTRECSALIRLALSELDTVDDT
jgi:hypothetical protein